MAELSIGRTGRLLEILNKKYRQIYRQASSCHRFGSGHANVVHRYPCPLRPEMMRSTLADVIRLVREPSFTSSRSPLATIR